MHSPPVRRRVSPEVTMPTTVVSFRSRKGSPQPLTMVTCYDATFAKVLAETDVDSVLVGDSVAMVVHGHPTTLAADLDMMVLHTAAVARGIGDDKLVVADLPFLAHRRGRGEAVDAAGALLKAGAHAVKLEGAQGNADVVAHLVESGIPVMGHVGLTPQFVNAFGGFKVQGRGNEAADHVMNDAKILEHAGVFAVVVEGVPAELGARITRTISVPTIGIGAGVECDGQVLVLHDLLGLTARVPKFVRRFADGASVVRDAVGGYTAAVHERAFPAPSETYS
jgi:3-methyl-2-oxobutanoate hydroxymethyltransferase